MDLCKSRTLSISSTIDHLRVSTSSTLLADEAISSIAFYVIMFVNDAKAYLRNRKSIFKNIVVVSSPISGFLHLILKLSFKLRWNINYRIERHEMIIIIYLSNWSRRVSRSQNVFISISNKKKKKKITILAELTFFVHHTKEHLLKILGECLSFFDILFLKRTSFASIAVHCVIKVNC